MPTNFKHNRRAHTERVESRVSILTLGERSPHNIPENSTLDNHSRILAYFTNISLRYPSSYLKPTEMFRIHLKY